MYNHTLYLGYWAVAAICLYIASFLFPDLIVLGSYRYLALEAAIYSGFWMTFIVWLVWDFILAKGGKLDPEYVGFSYFLLANIIGVLIVSRFTYLTGLKINGVWMVLGIATCVNIIQRLVRVWVFSKNRV